MYSVVWLDSSENEQSVRNIPLIQLAVDVLEKLDDGERESVIVTDNNPQGDVTTYAFELLIERYSPTDQNHDNMPRASALR